MGPHGPGSRVLQVLDGASWPWGGLHGPGGAVAGGRVGAAGAVSDQGIEHTAGEAVSSHR